MGLTFYRFCTAEGKVENNKFNFNDVMAVNNDVMVVNDVATMVNYIMVVNDDVTM